MQAYKARFDESERKNLSVRCFRFSHDLEKREVEEDKNLKKIHVVAENPDLKLKWNVFYGLERKTLDEDFDCDCSLTEINEHEECIHSYCHSYSIFIIECNLKVCGQFEISSSCPDEPRERINFDTEKLPFSSSIRSTSSKIPVPKDGKKISLTLKIYHEDESDKPAISNYSKFLENQYLSDITLVVCDVEIPAHKVIMSARSEFFAKMFELDMLEKKSVKIIIEDVKPRVFKLLLRFIYDAKIQCEDINDLVRLIVAADKYLVNGLVKTCEEKIIKKLSLANVVDVLLIANQINAVRLKQKCTNFISANKIAVFQTKAFQDIINSGRADLFKSSIPGILNLPKK